MASSDAEGGLFRWPAVYRTISRTRRRSRVVLLLFALRG